MMKNFGMSAANSSKFGGGSGGAPSISAAGSRKGATAPAGSINIMGKLGMTGTITDP